MKKNLTHAVVSALKPPAAGQVDVWDTRKPGFGIRISKAGTRTWLLMYRGTDGRKRRLSLGRFPTVSVADARTKATEKLGDVARGADPAAERQEAKAEPTFGEVAELYLKHHARPKKRPRSVAADEYMLRHDLLPAWSAWKLSAIRRRDVIALLDATVDRGAPTHANRVRALTSTIFNFAIARDLTEFNPAYRVPRPALERSRERSLSEDELRRLWTALEPESAKVQAVYKLAILTAARRSEILGMAWAELDLDSGWWTLPRDRSKGGVEHRIPLGLSAIALLRTLEASRKSEFVFVGGRLGRPVVTVQKWLTRIRDRAELADFHFHDIRRSVATGMSSIGVARLTISKLLGHAEGGITKIYDRHSYDPEKQAAVVRWDAHVGRLLAGKKSNVVQLHG